MTQVLKSDGLKEIKGRRGRRGAYVKLWLAYVLVLDIGKCNGSGSGSGMTQGNNVGDADGHAIEDIAKSS